MSAVAIASPGERLRALADAVAPEIEETAAAHDRTGAYPYDAISALQAARWFVAPIPGELGGLGVSRLRDLIEASIRLARADASVAIGANMHLAILGNLVRRHAIAEAAGDTRKEAAAAAVLRAIAREGTIIAAAISEPGQNITRPGTAATATADGWRIDGRKIFCTMSPAASVLYVAVTCEGRYAYAQVPTDAPGVLPHDDWDALGMRASGSQSITFDGVLVPAGAVSGGFPLGDAVGYMARNLAAGLFHASASLGVAEEADARAREALIRRGADARARQLVAESAVDLAAARATLMAAAEAIDDHHAAHPADDGLPDDTIRLFAGAQTAKSFVNEAAMRVVDRALLCSGGAGFMNGHPLSRAVRDVRAGMFMHPLGANRAPALLAQVALGEAPTLH